MISLFGISFEVVGSSRREGTWMEERAGCAKVTVAGVPGVEWDEDPQSHSGEAQRGTLTSLTRFWTLERTCTSKRRDALEETRVGAWRPHTSHLLQFPLRSHLPLQIQMLHLLSGPGLCQPPRLLLPVPVPVPGFMLLPWVNIW